jgi:hypothetical protein
MTMARTPSGDSFEDAGIDREQPTTGTRQQIREMKEQVIGQAKISVRQAKDNAISSLDESRARFADQIGAMADAFRRTGDHLHSENQQRMAGLTESVARQTDQVAKYIRDFDPRTARDDLESLARRQPALVVGGAFALGLLGARFFKSSRRRDVGSQTRLDDYSKRERSTQDRDSMEPRPVGRAGVEATTNAGETDAWR